MSKSETPDSPRSSDVKRVLIISVISSLIASVLFLAFLEPIVEFLSRIVSALLSHVASGTLDSMYEQAAIGSERAMLFLVLEIMLATMAAFAVFPFFVITIMRFKREANSEGKNVRLNLRNFLLIQSALSVCMLTSIVYMTSSSVIGIQATASYEQRMLVASPHLSEQEEEEFASRWASMEGRADYVALMLKLEEAAKDGGWKLPRRLI